MSQETRTAGDVAVYLLGAALLLSLTLIGGLAYLSDKPIPDVLVATPPTCLAGLLGLLAPRPYSSGDRL